MQCEVCKHNDVATDADKSAYAKTMGCAWITSPDRQCLSCADSQGLLNIFIRSVETLGITEQAKRYNQGKPQLSLLPLDVLVEVAKVLEFGAKKYSKDNWRKGQSVEQITDSLLRHLSSVQKGELFDEESQQLHSAHMACNILFMIYEHQRMTNGTEEKE